MNKAAKKPKSAISPQRAEDFPAWYQEVVKAANLAENSPVRGCMVIRPWGYGIWEKVQQEFDKQIKATGHKNAYFPLLIPLSYLEKEAAHIDGFAKECAVVTHHRLVGDGDGHLIPDGKLDEPFVIRPTSETIIGQSYSKWVQSYRDLPILINQWANIMRWEMRTRMFLRTSEFLWQEGHTVHETKEEAIEETLKMLRVYEDVAKNHLALPVYVGEKTPDERFPGALNTYCIEAMMQDRKALQSGTSHFLGQNFSRAFNIEFLGRDGDRHLGWTTSWGVSTRLIGGVVMTHSDDNGLVLPPKIAPHHVTLIPIYKEDNKAQVMEKVAELKSKMQDQSFDGQAVSVEVDDRDLRGGEKSWQAIKEGVPIKVELGAKDIEKNSVCYTLRHGDPTKKHFEDMDSFCGSLGAKLSAMQDAMLEQATRYRDENTIAINSKDDFISYFTPSSKDKPEIHGGFARCQVAQCEEVPDWVKKLAVSARFIPMDENNKTSVGGGKCVFTGEKANFEVVYAKSY